MITALFMPIEKSLCMYCKKDTCTIKLLFSGSHEPTMRKALEMCHSCAVETANSLKETAMIAIDFYRI